jgi:D-alanyl-lipoteichoic acid acyltransferase DltB (MBOAT superfamily)
MIFSTYKFVLLFLPIVLIVFRLLIKGDKISGAKCWLVAASLFFYCQGAISFAPIFLLTAIFNYFIGRTLVSLAENGRHEKKHEGDGKHRTNPWLRHLLFAVALLENLGLLGYFKYTNFFIENLNRLGTEISPVSIILPLGISFFTFNIIIYIVDSYRNKSRCYTFCDFMVFISFFPHLIMGPIVKHGAFIGQIENRESFAFDADNFSKGLFLFAIGCAKKVIIADPLIAFASSYYANPVGGGFLEAWTAVISYTLAYYYDFSGYGDMAVGLGLFFGVKLPVNFNSPYKARNFVDFWRRWNITLTGFLNEYIFGKVYRFGGRAGRLLLGVMITFLVSGIWHGAGWNFIAWGLVNGVFVFTGMLMTLYNKRLPAALAHALTLLGVLLTRVLFDSHSLSQAAVTFKSLMEIRELSGLVMFAKGNIGILCLILAATIIVFFTRNAWEHAEEFRLDTRRALWTGALLTASLFFMTSVSSFLYFQF